MTGPGTGAGGQAVGITAGPVGTGEDEAMWYRGCETCSETGEAWQGGEEFGECEVCSGRGFVWVALDDILEGIHPALLGVSRWLVDTPDGAIELWAHLDDLGEEQETPTLRSLRDALGAALATDGGA